jgi:hypothetical protein
MRAVVLALPIIVAGGPGCGLLPEASDIVPAIATAPDEQRFLPVISDTAVAGYSMTVHFHTYGGGCIRAAARTEQRVTGNVVELRPYNRRDPALGCCECDDLRMIPHQASVTFQEAGPAVVRIVGRNTVEQAVWVRAD